MPIAIIAGIVIIAVTAVGFIIFKTDETPNEVMETEIVRDVEEVHTEAAAEIPVAEPLDDTDPAVSQVVDTPTPTTPPATTTYGDGSYTAAASYFTPARKEHELDVTLTIESDEVTKVSILYDGGSASTNSLKRFDNAYEPEVIGVSLEDLSLSRVGGASLTSEAFNEAVDTIKQQAG